MGFAEWNGADQPARVIQGDFGTFQVTDRVAEMEHLLAPIDPRVILCIGLNYRAHAEETGKALPRHPMLFMKSLGAVQNPNKPIILPRTLASHKVDYEGELAVIIGRAARNVKVRDALDYVLGYTVANDVTARDWQYEWGGGQFCRGKTFDTFCPLGPCLATVDSVPDPQDLRLRTFLNGECVQDSHTGDMIFDVATLISFLSASTTLIPGTVILTGTPSGVGFARNPQVFLQPGDRVEVEIEGIGRLSNPVKEEVL